jgi:microsomal epoxide hydrolase/non-specific protein-tyrosine kinase
MDFPAPKFVDARGVRLATYEAGPRDGAPVILVHGWPEIAYSWKNQLPALGQAGYRAIAIDLKGFGASDSPLEVSAYTARQMTGDFAALLDALGIERAVFCGHDWGGALVWSMAQLHLDRVAGVIGVSTPLRKRPPAPPLEIIAKKVAPNHYFIRFQPEGVAEKLFESDIDRFFAFMFRMPLPREKWAALVPEVYDLPSRFAEGREIDRKRIVLSDSDLKVYADAYRRSGFRGGINLYRNIDANWSYMEGRDETVRAPSLWVGAELDLFLPPETAADMGDLVPNLEKRVIADCGHWVMWEKPAELNAILVDWLNRHIRS